MVRTLADYNNNQGGPNGPAANPLAMGRMSRDFDWKQVPTGFYFLSLTMLTLFLLSLFTILPEFLINYPELTVFKIQVWRVLFSYVCVKNIISLVISLLVIFSLSMTEETQRGTGRYMLQLFWRNLIIQLGVTFFGALLYLLFEMKVFSAGIWPVYFIYLTQQCYENPEGVTYFCMMPCPIKNKYYPILLLAIFTLLGSASGLPIDIWIGFALGVLSTKYIIVKTWFEPSDKWANKAQQCLERLDGKLGKVVPNSPGGVQNEGPFGGQQAPQARNAARDNVPGATTSEIVRPVFGGASRQIGGSVSNSIFTNYDHLDKQVAPKVDSQKKDEEKKEGQRGLILGNNDPNKNLNDSL